MTQRVTGQRFRQRKLSTKQNIPVLREHEIEKLDEDEASRHIPKVETGVEKGEEIVSHAASPFEHSLLHASGRWWRQRLTCTSVDTAQRTA
jgi:enhancer of polycomb-like protein